LAFGFGENLIFSASHTAMILSIAKIAKSKNRYNIEYANSRFSGFISSCADEGLRHTINANARKMILSAIAVPP
jgi:hypothetical protein